MTVTTPATLPPSAPPSPPRQQDVTGERVIFIARLFLYVREAQSLGQNMGQRVNAIQTWSGGQPGDSWCAEWVTMVLDIAYSGLAPLPRTGSCEVLRSTCEQRGWLTGRPRVGDLFFYLTPHGVAHHIGLVTSPDPLAGIAGNTSADGTSVNGDRVAERVIRASVFARYLAS